MGDIADLSPDQIRTVIWNSNKQSADGPQQYLKWESRVLHSDYEFIACPCAGPCWCKRNGCGGHYRLKELTFDQFLEDYLHLWIPPQARDNVKWAVLKGTSYSGRQKHSIKPLQWLRENWSGILDEVRGYDKCGLCDSTVPPRVPHSGAFNLYEAKMSSQLFYDSLVPFDSKSKAKIRRARYPDPEKDFLAMNRELFCDLRKISDSHGLGVPGIRELDSPWTVEPQFQKPAGGQPLSRVVDKIFYVP